MKGDSRIGAVSAIAAFSIWGLLPIYFHILGDRVTALEVSMERAIWAGVFIGAWLLLARRMGDIRKLLHDRRTVLILLVTAILVSANWFGFAFAAMNHSLEEASLGYFINPLLNVLLGFIFLHERLNKWQMLAVALAALGVANQILIVGEIPWLGLMLAGTFGTYGLLRKTVKAEAAQGLFVELILLAPLFLAGIFWLQHSGQGHFINGGMTITFLLILGGLLTAVPLSLFANGARNLNLASLGLIQYIAPSLQFALAIYYGEKITAPDLITFGLIWLGLAIYTTDMLHKAKSGKKLITQPLGMDPD